MSITLNAPLAWKTANPAEIKMLQSLQGNILKGHGRDFTANIFFRFGANQPRESRRVLRELANAHITNAHCQLLDNEIHKQAQASGQTVSVNYATADGVARSSGDYTAKTGTLTFAPGTALVMAFAMSAGWLSDAIVMLKTRVPRSFARSAMTVPRAASIE